MYMTTDDKAEIIEMITSTLNTVVPEVVTKVVNGKIDRLKQMVEDEFLAAQKRMALHEEKMAPAIETIQTLQSGRKAVLWIAAPVAAIGSIMALFKL